MRTSLVKRNHFRYETPICEVWDNTVLTAGQQDFEIRLENLNKHIPAIFFVIRPQANLLSNYTNNDRWQCVALETLGFRVDGRLLQPVFNDEFLKYGIKDHFFERGNPAHNIYVIPVAIFSNFWDTPTGGLDFSSITEKTLLIHFAAALGANHVLTIWVPANNFVNMKQHHDRKDFIILEPYRSN